MKLQLTTLAQRPDLVDVLAGWFTAEWPDYFSDRDPHDFVAAHAREDAMPLALLVLADDQPAGAVTLAEESIESRPDLGPWVAGLFVQPKFREQGIGQLLVVAASRIVWSLGFDRLYVGTRATSLFTAVGWTVIDTAEQDGTTLDILVLERPEEPPSLYDEIGGEEVVRALVDRFYDLMDELPEATEIRAMHARSLRSSRQKLFEFLSGWLGGPQLYINKHGHPRLRARHLPFSIGTGARDQWMMCMRRALEDTVEHEQARRQMVDSFTQMADHMRNRDGV